MFRSSLDTREIWLNLASRDKKTPSAAALVHTRNRWRALLFLTSGLFASSALADAAVESAYPQVWLNLGIYSHHFDTSKGLRNGNVGFGAEVALAKDHGLMGGTFINSNRRRTRYASYLWHPLHWEVAGLDVGAGVLVGAFDGYPYRDGAWFIAPLPVLSIQGKRLGANISLIPTVANRFDGAAAIQLKLRVW